MQLEENFSKGPRAAISKDLSKLALLPGEFLLQQGLLA